MDHLLHPPSPKHASIEVPYLCSEQYDGGPLESYPERKGWSTMANPETALGFIQTWLYFGLLHTTTSFSGRISEKMFISLKSDPSRAVIDTTPLLILVSDWIDRERALDSATRALRREQTRSALVFVARCMEGIYHASESPAGLEIIFSIEMLCEFLQSASLRAYDSNVGHDWRHHGADEVTWTNHHNFTSKSLVHLRLSEDRWCPNEVASLSLQFPGSGLYFISNLERPGAAKDHSKCTEFKCFAYQLVNSTYKTQHTPEGCICRFVHDDADKVRQILYSGDFPVISYLETGGKEVLNVVDAGSVQEYVAISHVWSDGLGNLQANALPGCQIRRLSHLSAAALKYAGVSTKTPPFFWVDTICCPPEDGEAQDIAISRMRETYEKATCVLVLDSWLLPQTMAGHSGADILVRIACSGWNRRLWTYQEGSLAKQLLFQFADGIFDLDLVAAGIYEENDVSYALTLQSSLAKQVLGTRGLRIPELSNALRIKSIMSSLKFRSTSVASDEALCLGAMLNLDVAVIQKASDTLEERMATLWRMLPEVPSYLLLFGGRRLQDEPLRWAPATLLGTRNPGWAGILKHTDERAAVADENGLHVQFPGFIIPAHSGVIFRKFYFPIARTRSWYEVCCYRTLSSDEALKHEAEGHGSLIDGTIAVHPVGGSGSNVSLVLVSQVAVFRPEVPIEVRSAGILAILTTRNDREVKARFLCDVTVQFKAAEDGTASFEEWIGDMRATETVIQDETQIWELLEAQTYEDQAWCIA
jgi:hypothetical protein